MAGRQASGAGGRRGAQPRPAAARGRAAPAPKGRAAPATARGRATSASKGRGAPERSSSRQFASRGAGRTGRITPTGEERRKPEKTLGGEQVEGRQAVRELLIAGKRKVSEVWVATDLLDGESASDIVTDIVEIARSVRAPVQEVNRKRLEAKARSEAPQGVIAFAAPLLETELADLIKRRPGRAPFLVAVDGVTDPGNLGAMLRCCDGAGVDGVVLPRHRAVHITPTVAKAAAGAVEHVPMALVGGLPAALARIKDAGIWVIGLDDGADRDLFDIGDLAREGVCLVLGAEGAGLSRLTRERCDMIVSIPMLGRLSSLNVSAAAALATYEIARQRRTP
jgi:23S rRNA (guanosine2251-2'-O)-methyltransferase